MCRKVVVKNNILDGDKNCLKFEEKIKYIFMYDSCIINVYLRIR